MEDYENQMGRYYDAAKKILMRDGNISPVAVIFAGTQTFVVPLYMPNNSSKHKFFLVLRGLAKCLKAEAVITVTEAWAASYEKEDEIPDSLENEEDRIEIIAIAASIRGAEPMFRAGQIIRNSSGKPKDLVPSRQFDDAGSLGGALTDLCGDSLQEPPIPVSRKDAIDMLNALIKVNPEANPEVIKRYKKDFKKAMH